MTWDYKCGHSSTGIVIDDSILTFSEYFVWAGSVGVDGDMSKCWNCWGEEQRKKIEEWKSKSSNPEVDRKTEGQRSY